MMALLPALTISFLSAYSSTLQPMLWILFSVAAAPHTWLLLSTHQELLSYVTVTNSNKWFQKICGFKYQKFNSNTSMVGWGWLWGMITLTPASRSTGQPCSGTMTFTSVHNSPKDCPTHREPGADPWGPQKTRSWAIQWSINSSPQICDFHKMWLLRILRKLAKSLGLNSW